MIIPKRWFATGVQALVGLVALPALTGCSFLFVTPPPSNTGSLSGPRPGQCTSSVLAPVVDSVIGGLQVARTAVAASADEAVYSDPNQLLSREADIALGVAFTTLFLASAGYGFYETSQCSELEQHHAADFSDPHGHEPETGAPEATEPEIDDSFTPAHPSPRAPTPIAPARMSPATTVAPARTSPPTPVAPARTSPPLPAAPPGSAAPPGAPAENSPAVAPPAPADGR